jgi:hypothetical protein
MFRNALDAKQHVKDLNDRGVARHLLQFGDNGPVDTTGTLGKFFIGLLAEIAELESNMIGDRTREVKRFKKGKLLAYSPTPFGFEHVDGKLVPVPKQLATVAEIRRQRGLRSQLPSHCRQPHGDRHTGAERRTLERKLRAERGDQSAVRGRLTRRASLVIVLVFLLGIVVLTLVAVVLVPVVVFILPGLLHHFAFPLMLFTDEVIKHLEEVDESLQ